MVTRLILVIVLKCIEILNHYIVYQELTQCCRLIIFQKSNQPKQTDKLREKKRSVLWL